MKFSAKEDLELEAEQAFEFLSDFDGFERSAMRRGADVTRVDSLGAPGVGMEWDVVFKLRGKRRELRVRLSEYDRPERMRFDFASPGIEGHLDIDLLSLARKRTRMAVAIEFSPKTLSARLLVQSLKLAKGNLNKRFTGQIAAYARDLESRVA